MSFTLFSAQECIWRAHYVMMQLQESPGSRDVTAYFQVSLIRIFFFYEGKGCFQGMQFSNHYFVIAKKGKGGRKNQPRDNSTTSIQSAHVPWTEKEASGSSAKSQALQAEICCMHQPKEEGWLPPGLQALHHLWPYLPQWKLQLECHGFLQSINSRVKPWNED